MSASYHKDYEKEVRELNQQKMELELQFPSLCLPDPDLSGMVNVKYLLWDIHVHSVCLGGSVGRASA